MTTPASVRVFTWLTSALLAFPVLASAQFFGSDDEAISKANAENAARLGTGLRSEVFSACGLLGKSLEYPASWHAMDEELHPLPGYPTDHVTFSVKAWTGGCRQDKRDGEGVLDTRFDMSTSGSPDSGWVLEKSSGTFVEGLRQGLWCQLDSQSFRDGKPSEFPAYLRGTCSIVSGEKISPPYRKLEDGRWQETEYSGRPAAMGTVLPAGTLERESARIIGEARQGKRGIELGSFDVKNNVLSDLVAGATLSIAAQSKPVDLRGKRVALLLSSGSLAVLQKFAKARLAFIEASSKVKLVEDNRANIIRDSEPQLLVKMIARALRARAGSVELVDDFVGLAKGDFDYAFVVDIAIRARFDLIDKYQDIPVTGAFQPQEASIIADESLGAYLVSPDMKIVKTYNYHPIVAKTYQPGESISSPSKARIREAGNISYFMGLESLFAGWRADSDAEYLALVWGL